MTLQMIGRLDECFLFTYAVDPERAASLAPVELEPVTCRGSAFLNIVVCRIDRLRPRSTPGAIGLTYWHVAYRLHVRARLPGGASIEGLYFLRSDVDRPLVGVLGSCLTDFKFHGASVQFSAARHGWNLEVTDARGSGAAIVRARHAPADRHCAPFSSIEERERFLKYPPFGLSISRSRRYVRVAEVGRNEALWREEPVAVETAVWRYPETVNLSTARLVRATRVSPIDYAWRIGRKVRR